MRSDVEQLPLNDRLWAWFETNKTQAVGGAVIVALVAMVVGFFMWRHGQQADKASEALSSVMLEQATMPNGQPATAPSFLKMAAEYPDSGAASRALIFAAADLFTAGKFDDSRMQFERFSRDHRDSQFMGVALLGVAACYDAQGKTNEAVTAYKDLIDHHPGETVLPQARFALARLYAGMGQPDKAFPLFDDVARDNPYSSVGSEAGMRLEELKMKYPGLGAAAAPAQTNAVPYKIEKK